jgi:hypothetical protein
MAIAAREQSREIDSHHTGRDRSKNFAHSGRLFIAAVFAHIADRNNWISVSGDK